MNIREGAVGDVVTACRALAARGCDTGIGGHVSIRGSDAETFWINSFDRTLGEITPDDVLALDHQGNNVLNDRDVSPGWGFHADIYRLRPDVNAIVHTHGFWITALASLARPLKMRHNLCTLFHGDQVVSQDDSPAAITAALRNASTLIMPWHGAITVGSSIARAAGLHATLADMAELDVRLDGHSGPEMPDEECVKLRRIVDEEAGILERTWDLMQRQADRYVHR